MSKAARSLFVFGLYLVATGAFIVIAPNVFLSLLGLPPAADHWFRVLGIVTMAIGFLDVAAGRAEQTGMYRASVWVRALVFLSFSALVVLKIAPPVLLLFGAIDAAGALWTHLTLRRPA